MAQPKVLLYYGFTPLRDPEAVRLWQLNLCEKLGIRGRIVVSPQGINGTVGGDVRVLKQYKKQTRLYPGFRDIDFKWSEGTADASGESIDFPRLRIKVKDELVNFGVPDRITVGDSGVVDGGTHLSPAELDELAERKDVVFFDGRNQIESAVGHFRGALTPPVDSTREMVALLDAGEYDHLKDKPVVTYCTGGIRCEILTPLLKQRGFTEVYQLDGGIARYGEARGDHGLWQGALYVFDERLSMNFSDHTTLVGRCDQCGTATNDVRDCREPACLEQFVRCGSCLAAQPGCADHE